LLDLRVATGKEWLEVVFADFDAFLVDHTGCEKKAFSNAMALISRFPEQSALVLELIEFCREELEHFQRMHGILVRRGLVLARDAPDAYAKALRSQVRSDPEAQLLDRLLVAGIIEARSCERLALLAHALPERHPELAETYLDLARSEARHHGLFFRLARQQRGESAALARAAELLDYEAALVARLPFRAAVH
jgi:tRNA 2-(methylsulfanyl)-N6-isopentenyladenosine37 hydroxylase